MFCSRKNSADVQPVSCLSVIISCVVIILGLIWRKINLRRRRRRRSGVSGARPATTRPAAARRALRCAPARPGAGGAVDLRFCARGAGGSRRVYYCTAWSSILRLSSVRKKTPLHLRARPTVGLPCSVLAYRRFSFFLVCIVAVNYCNAKLFCTGTYRYRT